MTDIKIGKVTHYYEKIQVAIIELSADLNVGDKIKFQRGGEDLFEQKAGSMEVEHNNIDNAKAGDVVGLKVDNEVKEGAEVYKMD